MSLHIPLSEYAKIARLQQMRRQRWFSLLLCVVLLLSGGLILYYQLIHIPAEPQAQFKYFPLPNPKPKPPTPKPVPPCGGHISDSASPSNISTNIILSSDSQVDNRIAPSLDDSPEMGIGQAGDIGNGWGTDGVGDIGDEGSLIGSETSGGSALTGVFYDLKQTAAGAASKITPQSFEAIMELFHRFLSKGWNERELREFYRSPRQLYASTFILPACDPRYAPIAYGCEDKVQPSAWVAHYKGKVRAPKSGRFRFVGAGDDVLAVRFGKKLVLEAGWAIPSLYLEKGADAHALGANPAYRTDAKAGKYADKKDYDFIPVDGVPHWNSALGGLTAGDSFTVVEGKSYDIEILISEIPGGQFGFALLIEEIDGKGQSLGLELFRTDLSQPTKESVTAALQKENCLLGGAMQWPKFREDSYVWIAEP